MATGRTPLICLAFAMLALASARGQDASSLPKAESSILGGLSSLFGGNDAEPHEPAQFNPFDAAKQIRRLPPQTAGDESSPADSARYDVEQVGYTQRQGNNSSPATGRAPLVPSSLLNRGGPQQTAGAPAPKRQSIAELYGDELLSEEPAHQQSAQPAQEGIRSTHLKKESPNPVRAAFAGALSGIEPDDMSEPVAPAAAAALPTTQADPLVNAQFFEPGEFDQPHAAGTAPGNPLNRPKILFQPVIGGVDSRGNALLRPDVQLAGDEIVASDARDVRLAQYPEGESIPPPEGFAPEMEYPVDGEWMAPVVTSDCNGDCANHGSPNSFDQLFHDRHQKPGSGVGREYVMHAPFFVDTTQPFNSCRVRTDYGYDWEFPDRAEYFWAKTPFGKGPGDPSGLERGEKQVNHQEIAFYIERGWERFSVGTNIPIRAVDPDYRLNTTGLADMEITQKLVFLDGCRWQLTQIMSIHPPTGSFRRGTGNGHLSLEPGFAWRYKWSDITYIQGDLTYWFPIAADPFWSGQILNHGIAFSHVLIDADSWALIPTFEVDAWTVLDGNQTIPGLPPQNGINYEEIDSMSIVNVYPGLRWVCDKGGDCSVKEFGISAGSCVTEDHWYKGILRLEFRWSR